MYQEKIKKKRIFDLGCGRGKSPEAIGLDLKPLKGVDVVCDLSGTFLPIRDSVADKIICYHVLEHMDARERINLLKEIHRILRVGGKLEARIPHKHAWKTLIDPTHKDTDKLILNMFDYYEPESKFDYYFDFNFRIKKRYFKNIVWFFPFREIKISGKHPIAIFLNFTVEVLTEIIANRWDTLLKFLPIEYAVMYFELEAI